MSSIPMNSGSLGTYKRYKLGQAQFSAWLKQATEKVRTTGSGGSAKQAIAVEGSTRPSKTTNESSTSLHWSQLEWMAKTVLDHIAPEQIPMSAVVILRDVVNLRRKSARFFTKTAEKSGNEKLQQKNSTHAHIIKVLEKILEQFEAALSRVRRPTSASPVNPDAQLGMADINNLFEHLQLEESHDADDDQPEPVVDADEVPVKRNKKVHKKAGKQKKPKGKPTKQQPAQNQTLQPGQKSWVDDFKWTDDEDEDEFDYYMLVYCFFQDFNLLRAYVGDRWCEYFYHKSVHIDTLAVITNAACEIFHEMEYELEKALRHTPELRNYSFMMQTLFFDYGLEHVDYSGESQLTEEELSRKIYEEADWVGFLAYARVEEILQNTPPGKVPLLPPSLMPRPEYGFHDVDGMRDFMHAVSIELFAECAITKALKTNNDLPMIVCAQDDVTLDFEHVLRVRDYPSAMIFGLSLYIDIRYILEDQVTDPFDLLQATAAATKAALEERLPRMRGSADLKRECRGRIAELDYCIIKDFTHKDKQTRYSRAGITEPIESHGILKKDPIWSGLLDIRCRLVLNDMGFRFIQNSPVVIAAAFVYSLCRLAEPSFPSWSQMDLFLQVHERDKILQGPVPEGMAPVALLQRFVASDLATTDASSIIGPSKPSRSLEALFQRYAWDSSQARHSMTYLREIIREKFAMDTSGIFSRPAALLPPPGATEPGAVDVSTASQAVAQKAALESARVSPVQLLEILDDSMTHILENQLALDYFGLYDDSVGLLRKLLEEFSAEADQDPAFTYGDDTQADRLAALLPVICNSMTQSTSAGIMGRVLKATRGFRSRGS
ncbi:hypothetical protein F4780DRAFT_187228 [Xylariomycetidae sp. FL0641]|nr:hypothetical protein F4780DRAFT_187228 [Xylariomycetidae sp. FL0641]